MSAVLIPIVPVRKNDFSVAATTMPRREVVVDRLPIDKKPGPVVPERAAILPPRARGVVVDEIASKPPENTGDSAKGGRLPIGLMPFSAAAAFIQYVIGERA